VYCFAPGISDTDFVFAQPLEANTSYRWRLRAHALNSTGADDITLLSQTSFVISSASQPTATFFYQSFPNPFPNARSRVTCFWFDLAQRSEVRLTIYDVRLRQVKAIVPGALSSNLGAGAYGRQGDVTQIGCDPNLAWDGTDD